MPRAENILLSAFLIFKHKGAFFMKVMEFSENTKVDCVVPEWAEFMDKGDHISYMPSFKGGEFLGLFDESICTAPENQPPFDSMTCYLFDPTKHGRGRNGKYPLLIFIHGATNALDGRKCIGHSGGEMFDSPDYQDRMGGAFILVPLANERRDENGMLADSWDVGYIPLVKKAADDVIAEYGDNISGVFVIGGSSGGFMSWAMAETYPDFFTGAMPVSADYVPSANALDELCRNNVKVFFAVGKHDEFGSYSERLVSRLSELESYDNINCWFPEWVRNGDGGIASLYFGIEMGQHCIITQVQADLMYDDASPYCEALPHGVTGWVKELVSG